MHKKCENVKNAQPGCLTVISVGFYITKGADSHKFVCLYGPTQFSPNRELLCPDYGLSLIKTHTLQYQLNINMNKKTENIISTLFRSK